jgi:hypothetical protein
VRANYLPVRASTRRWYRFLTHDNSAILTARCNTGVSEGRGGAVVRNIWMYFSERERNKDRQKTARERTRTHKKTKGPHGVRAYCNFHSPSNHCNAEEWNPNGISFLKFALSSREWRKSLCFCLFVCLFGSREYSRRLVVPS